MKKYHNPVPTLAENFLESSGWRQNVFDILNKVAVAKIHKKEFTKFVSSVNSNSFNEVVEHAVALNKSKILLKSTLNKIKELQVKNCLLILGSIGSGKTSLVDYTVRLSKTKNTLIFNFSTELITKDQKITNKSSPVEAWVLNDILNGDFSYFKKNDSAILFVLDDLEKVLELAEINILTLIHSIRSSAKFDNIKWVITTSDIAKVLYDPTYRNELAVSQYVNRKENDLTDVQSFSQFGGWYDLDNFNIKSGISLKIWNRGGSTIGKELSFEQINFFPPGVASILKENYAQSPNVNSDVIELLVKYIYQKLGIDNRQEGMIGHLIRSIKLYDYSHKQLRFYFDENDKLEVRKESNRDFDRVNKLSEFPVLSVSNHRGALKYVVNAPFLWAYYIAINLVEDQRVKPDELNCYSAINSKLIFHTKLMFQREWLTFKNTFSLREVIETYGELDSWLFLLGYADVDKRLNFLKAVYEYVNEYEQREDKSLTYAAMEIANSTSKISFLIYGLAKCIHAVESVGYEQSHKDSLVKYIAIIFKLLDNRSDSELLLDICEDIFDSLMDKQGLDEVIDYVYVFCSNLRTRNINVTHEQFLRELARRFYRITYIRKKSFFRLIASEAFEDVSYQGFYNFAGALTDAGFSYVLSEQSALINSSASESDHIVAIEVLNFLSERHMYTFKRGRFSRQFRLRELIVRSFHKSLGTRLRVLCQIGEDMVIKFANSLCEEYETIMKAVKHSSQTANLHEGRLYIFRHMDIVRQGEKAQIPIFFKKILKVYYDSKTIQNNFKFIELSMFISRVDNKSSKLKESGSSETLYE